MPRKNSPKPKLPGPTAPPRVPEARQDLDRAIMLLGSRQTQELRQAARVELETLLGQYPSPEVAASWKKLLKARRAAAAQ